MAAIMGSVASIVGTAALVTDFHIVVERSTLSARHSLSAFVASIHSTAVTQNELSAISINVRNSTLAATAVAYVGCACFSSKLSGATVESAAINVLSSAVTATGANSVVVAGWHVSVGALEVSRGTAVVISLSSVSIIATASYSLVGGWIGEVLIAVSNSTVAISSSTINVTSTGSDVAVAGMIAFSGAIQSNSTSITVDSSTISTTLRSWGAVAGVIARGPTETTAFNTTMRAVNASITCNARDGLSLLGFIVTPSPLQVAMISLEAVASNVTMVTSGSGPIAVLGSMVTDRVVFSSVSQTVVSANLSVISGGGDVSLASWSTNSGEVEGAQGHVLIGSSLIIIKGSSSAAIASIISDSGRVSVSSTRVDVLRSHVVVNVSGLSAAVGAFVTYGGTLQSATSNVAVNESGVVAQAFTTTIIAGWYGHGGSLSVVFGSVIATNAQLQATGYQHVSTMSLVSSSGDLNASHILLTAERVNMTSTAANYAAVTIGFFADNGNLTASNVSASATSSSATAAAFYSSVAVLAFHAWGEIDITGAHLVASDSILAATSIDAPAAVLSVISTAASSASHAISVTDLALTACGSNAFSSFSAVLVRSLSNRQFGRFLGSHPGAVTSFRLAVMRSIIFANSSTPEGDAFSTSPRNTTWSVIRNTTLIAKGVIGTPVEPTQLMIWNVRNTVGNQIPQVFPGARRANFLDGEACSSFVRDPLVGLVAVDCEALSGSGVLHGVLRFENCGFENVGRVILVDPNMPLHLTLINVTWRGGFVAFQSTDGSRFSGLTLVLERCNWSSVQEAASISHGSQIDDVQILIRGCNITTTTNGNAFAFTGLFSVAQNLIIDIKDSSIAAHGTANFGVASLMPGGTDVAAIYNVTVSAANSTIRATGVANVSVLATLKRNGPSQSLSVANVTLRCTDGVVEVNATGANVVVLSHFSRGDLSVQQINTSMQSCNFAVRGHSFVISLGLFAGRSVTAAHIAAHVSDSTLISVGSASFVVAHGVLADGGNISMSHTMLNSSSSSIVASGTTEAIVAAGFIANAVRATETDIYVRGGSVAASGGSHSASVGWIAARGAMDARAVSVVIGQVNVTVTSTSTHAVAAGWFADGGPLSVDDMQVTSNAAVISSAGTDDVVVGGWRTRGGFAITLFDITTSFHSGSLTAVATAGSALVAGLSVADSTSVQVGRAVLRFSSGVVVANASQTVSVLSFAVSQGPLAVEATSIVVVNSTVRSFCGGGASTAAIASISAESDVSIFDTTLQSARSNISVSSLGGHVGVFSAYSIYSNLVSSSSVINVVKSLLSGNGTTRVFCASWFANAGALVADRTFIDILDSTVDATTTGCCVAAASWYAGDGNLSSTSVHVAIRRSMLRAAGFGSSSLVASWAAWGNASVRDASVAVTSSTLLASGMRAPVVAIGIAGVLQDSSKTSVVVTDFAVVMCDARVNSSRNAVVIVARSRRETVGSLEFLDGHVPLTSNVSLSISACDVATVAAAHLGDCVNISPSAVWPSVIRDTTLRCGGNVGNWTSPSAMYIANVTSAVGADLRWAFPGSAQATFSTNALTCAAFVSDPLTQLSAVDCSALATGGRMRGTIRISNCTITDAESVIYVDSSWRLDMTLHNVTWTGGHLLLSSTAVDNFVALRLTVTSSRMTHMNHVLVLIAARQIRSVHLLVRDTVLSAIDGSAVSVSGIVAQLGDFTIDLINSTVFASSPSDVVGVGSVLNSRMAQVTVVGVSLRAVNTYIRVVSGNASVAALSLMKLSTQRSVDFVVVNVTIECIGGEVSVSTPSADAAALSLLWRGNMSVSSLAILIDNAHVEVNGASMVAVASTSVNGGNLSVSDAVFFASNATIIAKGSSGVALSSVIAFNGRAIATGTSFNSTRSNLSAVGIEAPVANLAVVSFVDTANATAYAEAHTTIHVCMSTVNSSGVALLAAAQSRRVGGTYTDDGTVVITGWLFFVFSSTVRTAFPGPSGACLSTQSFGAVKSVVSSVAVRCGGPTGPSAPSDQVVALGVVDAITKADITDLVFSGADTSSLSYATTFPCASPLLRTSSATTSATTSSTTSSTSKTLQSTDSASDSRSRSQQLPSASRSLSPSLSAASVLTRTASLRRSPSSSLSTEASVTSTLTRLLRMRSVATWTETVHSSSSTTTPQNSPSRTIAIAPRPSRAPLGPPPAPPGETSLPLPPAVVTISLSLGPSAQQLADNVTAIDIELGNVAFLGNRTCIAFVLSPPLLYSFRRGCQPSANYLSAPTVREAFTSGSADAFTMLDTLQQRWSWCWTLPVDIASSPLSTLQLEAVDVSLTSSCITRNDTAAESETPPTAAAALRIVFIGQPQSSVAGVSAALSSAAGAASILVSSAAGATAAQRQILLDQMQICPSSLTDTPLGFEWSPMQLPVGNGPYRYHVGAIYWNVAIFAMFVTVGLAVVLVVVVAIDAPAFRLRNPWASGRSSFFIACAVTRFPGWLTPVIALLYQPTLTSAIFLLKADSADVAILPRVVAGLIATAFVLVLNVMPFFASTAALRRHAVFVPTRKTTVIEDESIIRLLFATSGEYVSRAVDVNDPAKPSGGFVEIWGALFEDNRPEFWRCAHFDFLVSTVASLIIAADPQTAGQCNLVLGMTVTCFSIALAVALLMPQTSRLNNGCYIVVCGSQLAAAGFGAVSLNVSVDKRLEWLRWSETASLTTSIMVVLWLTIQIAQSCWELATDFRSSVEDSYADEVAPLRELQQVVGIDEAQRQQQSGLLLPHTSVFV